MMPVLWYPDGYSCRRLEKNRRVSGNKPENPPAKYWLRWPVLEEFGPVVLQFCILYQ